MKICFLMDPMETVKFHKDTSWILMTAAAELGHEVFHLLQDDLSLESGKVFGRVQSVQVTSPQSFEWGVEKRIPLETLDVIFIRKDPPFDRRYFYSTLLLDFLPSTTRVLNRPQSLRDWNEKLSALEFQQFCPPTLISQSKAEIISFCQQSSEVVLKPLDGFGGRGIYRVSVSDTAKLDQVIEELTHSGHRKIVVNPYLKEAEQGDKRILIVDGKPIGAILRKAQKPGMLNNLDQGGEAIPCELSDHDLEVCAALEPELKKRGLFFVGIDMLGPWLTEINVTSPTGLQELIRFSGVKHHFEIINKSTSI